MLLVTPGEASCLVGPVTGFDRELSPPALFLESSVPEAPQGPPGTCGVLPLQRLTVEGRGRSCDLLEMVLDLQRSNHDPGSGRLSLVSFLQL